MIQHRGFTFIEMLVAMSIAVGMMLFVNQIVGHSAEAVRLGESASQIIQSSRILSDQVTKDVERMVPASKGGVLLIASKHYDARILRTDNAGTPTPFRRSDQLMFIRFKDRLEPMCPQGDQSFTYDTSAFEATNFVRMWYGHGVITNDDGTTTPAAGDQLTQNGRNLLASNWILGRQALFLADPALDGVDTPLIPAVDSLSTHHALNARTSALTGTGGLMNLDGEQPNNALYHGTTDMASASLATIDEHIHGAATAGVGAGVIQAAGGVGGVPAWVDYLFENAGNRLRVNLGAPANGDTALVAQNHPNFIQNVSYFSVHFAGDYQRYNGTANADGSDGKIDIWDNADANFANLGAVQGQVKWYGLHEYDSDADNVPDTAVEIGPPNAAGIPRYTGGTLIDNGYAFTRVNAEKWPMLIRIRVRLHDRRALLAGSDGTAGRTYELIIPVTR